MHNIVAVKDSAKIYTHRDTRLFTIRDLYSDIQVRHQKERLIIRLLESSLPCVSVVLDWRAFIGKGFEKQQNKSPFVHLDVRRKIRPNYLYIGVV